MAFVRSPDNVSIELLQAGEPLRNRTMGIHGKYRRVVIHLKNWAVICLLLAGPVDALAQVSDRQISDELRKRRAELAARLDPYWDGFILKYEGNCEAATAKLHPIAALGLGYEEAQTALENAC